MEVRLEYVGVYRSNTVTRREGVTDRETVREREYVYGIYLLNVHCKNSYIHWNV